MEQSRTERLAALISADFYGGGLDLTSRKTLPVRASWDEMPEVAAARRLTAQSVPDDVLRLFLTFIAAMDRARDAASLWRAGVALFKAHPEVFDPDRAAALPFSTLRGLLAEPGVSQRHGKDARAWHRIAESLATGTGSRVDKVIRRGIGDAEELLREVRGRRPLPMLRGPKVGPMWVRMLADQPRMRPLPTADACEPRPRGIDMGVTMDPSQRTTCEYLRDKFARLEAPDSLRLRLRQSLSWLGQAREAASDHVKCVFLWISFNAAYADEGREDEQRKYGRYLGHLMHSKPSTCP